MICICTRATLSSCSACRIDSLVFLALPELRGYRTIFESWTETDYLPGGMQVSIKRVDLSKEFPLSRVHS